jgi:RNA polymerase sigma factor (sigma-70 family)
LSTPEKHRFVVGIAAKYSDRLRRFLKARLPNPSDVPDLAQEVFLSLLRVPNHEDIRSPEAYLFTVASHIVQQHHQRHVATPVPMDWIERLAELPLASSDEPPAKMELQQRIEHLERLLDEMPPRMAMALLMHRVAGHTVEEIASELGVAEITVKKYLAKALLHCRARGEEYSGG